MESIKQFAAIALTEQTQIAVARRTASEFCRKLGFDEDKTSRAEILAVELAGNTLQHGGGGTIFIGGSPSGCALQLVAADMGQGIGSLERAMQDGFSTGTTPGTGLGAVRRIADSMDVYSRPGLGTVVAALLGACPQSERTAVLSLALAGEALNGDAWGIFIAPEGSPERTLYLVVDGLGHGLHASEASAAAARVVSSAFAEDASVSLTELMNRMHNALRATRGAAVAMVSVSGRTATCCGVGNVTTTVIGPGTVGKTMLSHNGTVGHQMRRVQEFVYPFAQDALLVMHSDGLSARWKLPDYPALEEHSPAAIAGVLFRDKARFRDDATVLVGRLGHVASRPAAQTSAWVR